MSRTVCSWCKAPLVLKDDILVCSNTDCPACDEKYLHEELIRTRKALEIAKEFIKGTSQTVINDCDNLYVVLGNFKKFAKDTLEQITELEQKD